MNLPSASPHENMSIDNSINPMPARGAERSSAGEIFARMLMSDRPLYHVLRRSRISRRNPVMTEFDPAAHRMVPEQRWFEDFVLGERFVIPSRTMTAAVFAAFQTASADSHPVHYDIEYCRARGMPNLLAHGFQTLIHTA